VKLERVELAPFALRMRSGAPARPGWAVRLLDAEGRAGHGEAAPLPSHGTEAVDECLRTLRAYAPGLRGRTLSSVAEVEQSLESLSKTPAARHALELALLDLLGQERGQSVARLLGGPARTEVELSALLSAEEPAAVLAEARAQRGAGFRCLKLKVGRGPVARDLERASAAREGVGPGGVLRLDANGAWDLATAQAALRALEPLGLEMCEQPVASPSDLAALSVRVAVPLAADECLADARTREATLALRAARVAVLKPLALGGLLPSLRLAQRARALGLEVVVTTALDGALARAGALALAGALPDLHLACGLWTGPLVEDDLGPEPIRAREGRAPVDESPGLDIQPTAPLRWEAP
jgi:o-succinylbenzoate synthase